MRKPFYRKSHKCWYCKDASGKFIRLDPEESVAWEMWSRIQSATQLNHDPTYRAIAEAFLKEHKSTSSYNRILRASWSFLEEIKECRCSLITQSHVIDWVTKPKLIGNEVRPWSLATQRDNAKAVMRVFAWARRKEYIQSDPLSGMRFQDPPPREVVIPKDIHRAMISKCLSRAESKPFALYLMASRSGARPQQLRELTSKNIANDYWMWVFKNHKTRGKTGKPLIVYLTPCLRTLTMILAHRPGNLLLNADGNPWKKDTVAQKMRRLCESLKCEKVIPYAYRHTFATDALLSGASLATVAELLGHTDTRMVGKVYGHLDQHKEHLIKAAAGTLRMGAEAGAGSQSPTPALHESSERKEGQS